MSPEILKSISTVISFINISLIVYGAFNMFEFIRSSIPSYQIKDGRYCYGCSSEIISDDEYFKQWASNWVINGAANASNPNPFKPKEELRLCKSCERDQKLSEITNKINWNKVKKFIIENERKIEISLIGIFALLVIIVVGLAFAKISSPWFSIFYNLYLSFYWSYFIFKARLYKKSSS